MAESLPWSITKIFEWRPCTMHAIFVPAWRLKCLYLRLCCFLLVWLDVHSLPSILYPRQQFIHFLINLLSGTFRDFRAHGSKCVLFVFHAWTLRQWTDVLSVASRTYNFSAPKMLLVRFVCCFWQTLSFLNSLQPSELKHSLRVS